MCTVTFIPTSNGYYLTSNRDEKSTRSTAKEPRLYNFLNSNIIFPKDTAANGTWIVLKENGDSLCLLNGAFENFIDTGDYKKSRGTVVVEIASAKNIVEAFRFYDLDSVAPFTLIMVENNLLFECRWDGTLKHIKKLDNTNSYLWSSATLYNEAQRKSRDLLFLNFINTNPTPQQKDIVYFHKNAGDGNVNNNLVMQRDNKYSTVSITCITVNSSLLQMQYENLLTNNSCLINFTNEFVEI